MGQNMAARVALKPGVGAVFLTTDAEGRLLVSTEAPVSNSVAAFSPNAANAVATASLPAVGGKTNSLSGFTIFGLGASASGSVLATVTGLAGGTLEIPVAVPGDVHTGVTPVVMNFTQPLPASAPNVPITITLPALGAGSTNAAVALWGVVG